MQEREGGRLASAAVQVVSDLERPPFPGQRTVVTIGAYDGVHLGHLAVINQVKELAAGEHARSVVLTFDRHPAEIVRPESAPQLLTSPEQRLELLEATGLDATVVLHFDEAQSKESPESFIERVLIENLAVKIVVVGQDFHFGSHREGNVRLLEAYGRSHDFFVEPVQLVERSDGVEEPISSTAIRRALAGGDVEVAARMLGRPHEVRGIVVMGDQRGRLLGFPTANVEVPNAVCMPADGVYAGWYRRPDGSAHPCAINLGRRPTFYEHADHSLLEAHLIDFDGDLYGQHARVQFVEHLRPQQRFGGIDELVSQLGRDIAATRGIFGL